MKAVIKTQKGKDNLIYTDVEKPICKDNEVLIKIKAIAVCGSDYHIYTGEFPINTPIIIGHEFSGEIVEIGDKVKNLKIGNRVVSELNVGSCGVCKHCKTGNPHICLSRTCPGFIIDGVFAEYINMPANFIHKIGDNVTFEEAAVTEPCAIVAHALLERTKISPEDFVVVFGPGPIGLIAAQMAKNYGARAVMVVGTDVDKKQRLPLAEKLKADYVVSASETDVAQMVLDLTRSLGADVVVEASGAAAAINTGIEVLRKHGKMCVIGIPGSEKLLVDWTKAVKKAQNIIFNYSSSPLSWDLVLSMLNRNILDVKSLISHRESLENYKKVFKEIEKGNVIKAVLHP